MESVKSLIKEVKAGNRRALARAITLVESTRTDHRDQALLLMDELLEKNSHSIRIGLTGTPGVGKSTFIESFGMMLIKQGFKVAVLAVDPTSKLSGGSILGDKTRMELLSREPAAFIRPSPSQEYQGGVAPKTREAIALCEAANFDLIIVETVGVGQSEVMVSEMTDIFLLLMAPGGGDELQGVKRGIMEIADLILVNKADGELKSTALRTCADYAGALRLLRKRQIDPDDFPKALTLSSLEATGLDKVWREINLLKDYRAKTGIWIDQRRNQSLDWFESELKKRMIQKFEKDSKFLELKSIFQKEVWDEKRKDVLTSCDSIYNSLKEVSNPNVPDSFVKKEDLKEIFESIKDFYDEKHGGFGEAPKFPSPQNMIFLSKFYKLFDQKDAMRMVEQTLTSMRLGGIFDHIGFGFHRYSTDIKWQVPHFEKMLYDQAMILESFAEAYSLSSKDLFRETAEEIYTYVNEVLRSKEGAFFSAEDANSYILFGVL